MGGGEGTSRKRRSSPSSGEEEGRGRKRRDNKESRGRIRDDREEEEEDDRHKKRKKGKHSDRDRDRGKERYSKDRHSKEEESKRKDKDAASSPMTFKEISKDDYFEKGAAADPLMAGQQRGGSAGSAAAAGAGASPSLSNGSWEGMARNRHFILGFMYGYYKEAVVTLPLEHIPALAPRLLDTGICFGFGDPITNIIANTLRFLSEGGEPAHGEPQPGGIRKQKLKPKASRDTRARDEVLSKIVADNVPSPPEAQSIAERSLEGLVTFLTSYYCYLPTWDALRYLCLSRADLLVAVRLIEVDRCHRHRDKFRIHSQAVKIALKCAALSARLPNIDAFVNDSAAVVSHLTRIMPAQSRRRRLSIQDVARFARLLEKPLELKKLSDHMHLAAMRCHQYDMKVPPALTESLRSILLDRIHVVYLTAISRIPMDDFRSRHHHGLLKAGYCYGPFSPILNVVVSTVWYDTEFPAPEAFNLDMICTRLLIRIESRSLDGLISLFLACTSDFSEHDAMVYLLKSNMELPRAIQMAGQDGYDMASLNAAAFKAAGDASSHPQLEAYLHFVMESLPVVQPAVTELLSTETLSSSKIHHLSTLLSSLRSYPYKSLKPMDELTKDALEMVSRYKEEFFSQQNFVRKKVEAALKHYEKTELVVATASLKELEFCIHLAVTVEVLWILRRLL
ncbi:hypothetical protein BS78_01G134300 [Paspalum vaginatum]|nr:hypothetical protein BS78_01G134300 [Paspalum vaginatum]